jgi:hypothetical protein
MLGLVLCAFFVLGVMTGFSAVGRSLALRISGLFRLLAERLPFANSGRWLDQEIRWAESRFGVRLGGLRGQASVDRPGAGAIALVERHDGFYALFSDGELRGPVSPAASDDLPILSGRRVENARGSELVEFAAMMVRAEAQLSHLVSEMNVDGDGTASLYLDRARTVVIADLDAMPHEISRAAEILNRWRERESLIAAIDMTTPGEAVVRLADTAPAARNRAAISGISDHAPASPGRVSGRKTRSPR